MSSNCLQRPLLVQDFQILSHFYLRTMWLYASQIDLVLADQYQDVWGYNNEVFELARESLNITFRILLLLQFRQDRNNKVDTGHLLSHFLLHRIIDMLLRKLFSVHLIKICFVWIQSWICFLSRRRSFRRIIGWQCQLDILLSGENRPIHLMSLIEFPIFDLLPNSLLYTSRTTPTHF